MAHCQPSSFGNEALYSPMGKQLDEIRRTSKTIETKNKSVTRYNLDTKDLINDGRLKRERFGEEDKNKPHKTILMVGETGTGKSTLINAIINYMLGVKWKDRIWCEITNTNEQQSSSQTKAVTVYDVFVQESPFSLTIIDTPGFGSTEGKERDLKVTETLHELCRSKDGVQEIDLVCLVVLSSTTRLTDRQKYVFDSILSLFGRDVEKNIVLLITRAPKKPTSALRAIEASGVRCAKTDAGPSVCFWFDSSHCEDFHVQNDDDDDEEEDYKKTAWDKNEKNMEKFFAFLSDSKPVSMEMTEHVLRTRKQLTAAISNLKDRIKLTDLKNTELKQTIEALEKYEKEKKDMNNFEYEVDEPYKEKVPIAPEWWHLSKEATCCSVCEENCHYPGCWWVRDLSWCSVMTNGKCTVCTRRCDYTKHVKEGKSYVLKTRRVKKTYEDLKKKYEKESEGKMSCMSTVENEIRDQEREKNSLVDECYQCMLTLEMIALNSFSDSVLQNLDFLTEKMKETGKTERVQRLEEMMKRAKAKSQPAKK